MTAGPIGRGWRPELAVAGAVALAVTVVFGAGCASSKPTTGGRVRVVAAENTWGDVARQVGGARADVTSLISDARADPHLFDPTARDSGAVADADVVVANGLGYDDFVGRLVDSTSSPGRVVLTVADVLGVHGHDANPHLWYDVARVPEVALAIERALGRVDPPHRSVYAANRDAFDRSLAPVLATLRSIRRSFAGSPVASTERVAEPMLRSAGLRVVTPPGFARAVEDGTEPSPRDVQRMERLLRGHRVRALVLDAQATSVATDRMRALAHRSRIPVVTVTETLPVGAASYQAWQLRQARELRGALEQSS
ncbi:MAG: zinc ABC transporter substrate-binding protein [Acidimicrobiia bacterium]